MNISQVGIDLITSSEGFQPTPKLDTGGKPTWGFGHNRVGDEPVPESITEADALTLLMNDLTTMYVPQTNGVLTLLGYTANQNQFDALCSFCFNEGMGNLHEMLRHGWDQVPNQILRWHYAGGVPVSGLLARRERELALFHSA